MKQPTRRQRKLVNPSLGNVSFTHCGGDASCHKIQQQQAKFKRERFVRESVGVPGGHKAGWGQCVHVCVCMCTAASRKEREHERERRKKEGGYLTRRCALRESLPPTEVTLHVYVPMSPDQVWEM